MPGAAEKHTVRFIPSGRGRAQCPANPDYPDGIDLVMTEHAEKSCRVDLPYPAPECGSWLIVCAECDMRALITAAGRPDDPKSVTLPCKVATVHPPQR